MSDAAATNCCGYALFLSVRHLPVACLQCIKGILFVLWVVVSAVLSTVFFFAPVLLLHPIAPTTSLQIIRGLAGAWFSCGVLWFYICGMRVTIDVRAGIDTKQLVGDCRNLLIVSNHFCRLDWLFTWMIELPLGWYKSKVITLKNGLRHIFGIGWAMQSLRYVFLERNWNADKDRITACIKSLQRDGTISMLLYPEGTDLSKSNRKKSHEYAREKGLQQYQNVLHPKRRGFVHIYNTMSEGQEPLMMWDLTVGYEGISAGECRE